ncbi:MAG: hypothetical protein Q4G08_03285 [Capnocytophaga sp.]|nr:hypothetical protein [Capnocytophaga sp.]
MDGLFLEGTIFTILQLGLLFAIFVLPVIALVGLYRKREYLIQSQIVLWVFAIGLVPLFGSVASFFLIKKEETV